MILLAIEAERLCGYRKVGKLYLVGSGVSRTCDGLPLLLEPCGCCDYKPKFSRNIQWIEKKYISHLMGNHLHCECPTDCEICYSTYSNSKKYGLMWVGRQYYTPEGFVIEANRMGVSKAIPNLPKDLELGITWVLLAHEDAYYEDMPFDEDHIIYYDIRDRYPAVFYAFIPQRVEMLIWQSEATTEKLNELWEQGITPILVPDGDLDHQ